MKIILLTSVYPADDMPVASTSVVHYFTKEWVAAGHDVKVFHYKRNFPRLFNTIIQPFSGLLTSLLGFIVIPRHYDDSDFEIEHVPVHRITLRKLVPHGRFSNNQIEKAYRKTRTICERDQFVPDAIIGHWHNPQLVILDKLKQWYAKPTCLVLHDSGSSIKQVFKTDYRRLLTQLDYIGFRSKSIQESFESQYTTKATTFICHSGIPERFLEQAVVEREFKDINRFIYIGALIKRKHPLPVLKALSTVAFTNNFILTYIGSGREEKNIAQYIQSNGLRGQVNLPGRVDRDEIIHQLDASDVFIMISEKEAYGLVYLEAMARGCITVAAKNEGFDGIIVDGFNGFLCLAGDSGELASIITKIKKMEPEWLQTISKNAIETASRLTDANVARDYLSIFSTHA